MTDSPSPIGGEESLWSKRLALGIPLIDGQHRNLVERLEALLKALQSGHPAHELRQCLDFVERYTQEHFQTEEHYMQLHSFPGIEAHQELHRQFRESVRKARRFIEGDPQSSQSLKLVRSILINWYLQHIRGNDQEYVAHFRDQGVSDMFSS
jgi:hemerythrin